MISILLIILCFFSHYRRYFLEDTVIQSVIFLFSNKRESRLEIRLAGSEVKCANERPRFFVAGSGKTKRLAQFINKQL